ncbi:MAG: hypothetical protein RQ875_07935 [Vicingaceae bacterium]|nr:hypothetical protein [Vicingaceae bacterium]
MIRNSSFEEVRINKKGAAFPKYWDVEYGPNSFYEGEWKHKFPPKCSRPIPFDGEKYLKLYLGYNKAKLESDKLVRSYFCSKLQYPLIKNQKYIIEFYTQLPKNERRGFNCFSIGFSKEPYDRRKKNLDDILYMKDDYYTSRNDWELISFTYVANGNEKYISIGNFLEFSEIKFTKRFREKFKECYKQFDYHIFIFVDFVTMFAIDSNNIKIDNYVSILDSLKIDYSEYTQNTSMETSICDTSFYIKSDLLFELDDTTKTVEFNSLLNPILTILNNNEDCYVYFNLHTNKNKKYNGKEITSLQSEIIKKYFIRNGIIDERISCISWGSTSKVTIVNLPDKRIEISVLNQ